MLFESIFKRQLTEENTPGYLENIAREHPYFSIAQFYLLQLSPKDEHSYKLQASKTAILFNNNHWLNYQLLEAAHQNNNGNAQTHTPFLSQSFAEKNFTEKTNEPFVATSVAGGKPVAEKKDIPVVDSGNNFSTPGEETNIPDEQNKIKIEETLIAEHEKNITGVEQKENIIEQINTAGQKEEDKNADETLIKEPANNSYTLTEQGTASTPVKSEEQIINPVEEISSDNPVVTNEAVGQKHEMIDTEEIKTPKEEVERLSSETTGRKEELLFEPLHTTDYFASVGIKLSEEEKTGDKLGKQLMSFTQWLKTMKKVHAEQTVKSAPLADAALTSTESNIQTLAEKSNQENDVVTEAMAEVLLQQGRQSKAIEILQKLSLLNPGKSAYFAAKINQIKEK